MICKPFLGTFFLPFASRAYSFWGISLICLVKVSTILINFGVVSLSLLVLNLAVVVSHRCFSLSILFFISWNEYGWMDWIPLSKFTYILGVTIYRSFPREFFVLVPKLIYWRVSSLIPWWHCESLEGVSHLYLGCSRFLGKQILTEIQIWRPLPGLQLFPHFSNQLCCWGYHLGFYYTRYSCAHKYIHHMIICVYIYILYIDICSATYMYIYIL